MTSLVSGYFLGAARTAAPSPTAGSDYIRVSGGYKGIIEKKMETRGIIGIK